MHRFTVCWFYLSYLDTGFLVAKLVWQISLATRKRPLHITYDIRTGLGRTSHHISTNLFRFLFSHPSHTYMHTTHVQKFRNTPTCADLLPAGDTVYTSYLPHTLPFCKSVNAGPPPICFFYLNFRLNISTEFHLLFVFFHRIV